MSKSLSNVLKATYSSALSANSGGTGLSSSGNTGNVLTSTGSGWVSASLPIANTATLGVVKVDGTSITINANGVISGASTYTLPTANTTTLGGVKVDGTTIIANNGVISANSSGGGATKTISNQTAAYTVVAGDLGKIINCTSGTFTVSLTAAATLGSGFTCTIWNTSSTSTDAITIDPSGAETIDGASTLVLKRGEGMDIVCDGANWQTSYKKVMRGYTENLLNTMVRPFADGLNSIAIGEGAGTSGSYGISAGYYARCPGTMGTALGSWSNNGSAYGTALGTNSGGNGSTTATSSGAMALGGSYASGVDSFAAAIGNNTSSYGATGANSIAFGYQAIASGSNGKAIGNLATASDVGGLAISTGNGSFGATASGAYNIAIGRGVTVGPGQMSTGLGQGTVSSSYSVGIGFAYSVTADMGVALGAYSNTGGIIGKISFGSANGYGGAALAGKTILSAATTTTAAVVLTTNNSTAAATNQLIVATNQAMTFFGTLIAKQTASANMASYMFKGAIVNNAGTVSISSISIETIVDTIGLTTQPTFTADNTNKGLAVTSGAKLSTGIRWAADINSVEVTYA